MPAVRPTEPSPENDLHRISLVAPYWVLVVILARLLLLFCLVPLVELVLLLQLADATSWQATLLLVIVTGIVGAALARYQGFQVVRRVQSQLSAGELPAAALWDGLLILIAGALLLTPGILTDVVGFALLVPFCRSLLRRYLGRRFRGSFRVERFGDGYSAWAGREDPSGSVIDVDSREPQSTPDD